MLPRQASLFAIDNPHIALSACKPGRAAGSCVLRVCNLSDRSQAATIRLGFPATSWCPTDLDDTWQEDAARAVTAGSIAIALQPHQILTLLLSQTARV